MEKKLLVIAVKLLIILGYVVIPDNSYLRRNMYSLEKEFKSLLEAE
jgi:hypothetical protein